MRSRTEYIAAVLILAGTGPFVWRHLESLLRTDEYQFFPFVLAASVYLLWQRWPWASVDGDIDRRGAGLWLAASLLLASAGVFLWIPWLVAISAILAIRGIVLYLVGREHTRQLTSAWLLLWLLVPPPYGIDVMLRNALQRYSSLAASGMLDAFGVNHVLQGNTLRTPAKHFFVEEACSGSHSLFAILAVTAIYAAALRRPVWRTVCLFVAAVFWAGLLNVVRIVLVVAAELAFGWDISQGLVHDALGIVLAMGAVLLLLSTDQIPEAFRSLALRAELNRGILGSESRAMEYPSPPAPLPQGDRPAFKY